MTLRVGPTFYFLLCVSSLYVAADPHAPEIHTAQGSLRGKHVRVKGKETGVHAFFGIPFAKPPVGPALRLAAPQPADRWEGVRDATQQPPMCIQHKEVTLELYKKFGITVELPDISEDCLYLNVYTPANRAPDAKLPVMVWIHGGGFSIGSASTYDGVALAAYQDVVVVLIQYRLGLLGFLSSGDEHMPGNFGLLDQVQALRWTQEHIHNFGGDPDLVTIFGESAGGVSVSLLLLSPLSDGLFHRAIAESGTASMGILVDSSLNDFAPVMKVVANRTRCSLDSTEVFAECIKNIDIATILDIGQDPTLRFAINKDGHFLEKTVDEMLQKHEVLTVPFMTGVNDHEGGWLLPSFLATPNWTEGMDREQVITAFSVFFPDPKQRPILDMMVDEYTGNSEDRVKNRDGYTEMLGDVIFTIPAIQTANIHRDAGAPVYLYEYQYPPKFLQETRPSFVGSDHGDEIFVVFGFCFSMDLIKIPTCTEEEEELSKIVMSYWGNFARTGSPNGVGLAHWPQYGVDEMYLQIGLKQTMGQYLKKERFDFLNGKIQKLEEKEREEERDKEREKERSEL